MKPPVGLEPALPIGLESFKQLRNMMRTENWQKCLKL